MTPGRGCWTHPATARASVSLASQSTTSSTPCRSRRVSRASSLAPPPERILSCAKLPGASAPATVHATLPAPHRLRASSLEPPPVRLFSYTQLPAQSAPAFTHAAVPTVRGLAEPSAPYMPPLRRASSLEPPPERLLSCTHLPGPLVTPPVAQRPLGYPVATVAVQNRPHVDAGGAARNHAPFTQQAHVIQDAATAQLPQAVQRAAAPSAGGCMHHWNYPSVAAPTRTTSTMLMKLYA